MLSRRENIIMKYIFNKCANKGTCIFSCDNIISELYPVEFSEIEVREILNNLVLDEYISLIKTEKNKKEAFCVTLKEKGESFLREKSNKKKTWAMSVFRTVILAIVSFICGVILKAIF